MYKKQFILQFYTLYYKQQMNKIHCKERIARTTQKFIYSHPWEFRTVKIIEETSSKYEVKKSRIGLIEFI